MRSFRAISAMCLACVTWIAFNVDAQMMNVRAPSVLSRPNPHAAYYPRATVPQFYASPPAYPAAAYSSPGHYQTAMPSPNAWLYQPVHQPSYGYYPTNSRSTRPHRQVSPGSMYAPGQTSVMLYNSNLIGGPPTPQPEATGGHHGHAHGDQLPWTNANVGDCDGSCDPVAPTRQCNWFGSASNLYMTRDRGNHYTFSYGTLAEDIQHTNTRDSAMGWSYGYDFRFGRYFNCERNAVEVVYWSLFPGNEVSQTVSADVTGNLNGILNWDALDYGGLSADNYVNVAGPVDGVHQIERSFDFQNIEINVWQFCTTCGGGGCECSRYRFNWIAGARYFRFHENLVFGADANDSTMSYENDEIFYNIDIDNDLIGFQIGNELEYCLNHKWTLDMGVKLGVYHNRISHISEIGGGLGVATINNGPFNGREFWVSNSKDDIALLGEANIGVEYCINPCWTATVGYRAFAVTGVALPAEQIYPDLRGINDVEIIDSNGSLILHGGYAGLEYCW